ncbi:Rieske 2Fe-2S domain-containing protein [Streptomyces sp. NPDC002454]|jgi:nitrite reductase/ring-hydroxylating ferredoxin subunit|uniref:Rieske (2Fe-2S) protein n=1 Tax=unclassified Streptomyces TaxID=2593676 RepID=UPI00331D4BF6
MSAHPTPSRRTLLQGAAAVPVAGIGLTACSATGNLPRAASATPTAPVDLGPEAEVAKGETKLFRKERVVVTRAADGALTAYGSVCTHGRCAISKLEGTTLVCPCHGSHFDATTGEVLQRPATVPLPKVPVRIEGGKLIAGPDA